MRAFGKYLLSSHFHAVAVISLTAVISFYLSSILIALAVMRRGGTFGLQVIAGCMVVVVLALSLIHQLSYTEVLLITLRTWLPVWCCAMVLRKTESQAAMTLAAGAFGGLFIVLMYVLIDDVPIWWQTWFNDLLDVVVSGNMTDEAAARIEQLKTDMALIAPMINPIIVSFLVIRLITIILIGRWWQSLLYHPGGFRKEFYSLQIPRYLIYPALAGVAMMLLGDEMRLAPVRDLLWLIIIIYLFQGLSSVHRLVHSRELSMAWLVAMYSFLAVLFPHMIIFIACIGMADSWLRGKRPRIDGDTGA